MSPDRVLVVEDDTEIAALLAGGLTAEGYHVDLADCAAGLDQRLRDGGYDLVVLDRMLPDGDGADLCQGDPRGGP
ncbi:response regulator transcription factor [Paracoccus sp. (in: a-proteobacteria)]|uniref:response regulator transcription factor n=1 Tax=Paracoccus sp. TaxID=267 RepID=UPI00272B3568|nr:response regulator [Paracoccus sp. (in: a-proteobacteria)]